MIQKKISLLDVVKGNNFHDKFLFPSILQWPSVEKFEVLMTILPPLISFCRSGMFSFYPLPNYSLFDPWCHHHLVKSFISHVNPTIAASKKYEDDIFIPLR